MAAIASSRRQFRPRIVGLSAIALIVFGITASHFRVRHETEANPLILGAPPAVVVVR
jgi:hypothetical protein